MVPIRKSRFIEHDDDDDVDNEEEGIGSFQVSQAD